MESSPLVAAQQRFKDTLRPLSDRVSVPLGQAAGRTCAVTVTAPEDIPPYSRALVEGYLVKAVATVSASDACPRHFTVAGEVRPSDTTVPDIGQDEVLRVATGSLVPPHGYAVIRPWDAEEKDGRITITRPFEENFFVEVQGSDLRRGAPAVLQGTVIGPWEIALLAGFGQTSVEVVRQPTVAIFASGDELVGCEAATGPGRIRDCNSPMLAAAVTQAGGIAHTLGIMKDDFEMFLQALRKALVDHDAVVISGGTAVGGRDFIADLLREVGDLIVDGVPMRSGKPLVMGVAEGKPIVCVAGYPPEALRGFRLFGVLAITALLGRDEPLPADG